MRIQTTKFGCIPTSSILWLTRDDNANRDVDDMRKESVAECNAICLRAMNQNHPNTVLDSMRVLNMEFILRLCSHKQKINNFAHHSWRICHGYSLFILQTISGMRSIQLCGRWHCAIHRIPFFAQRMETTRARQWVCVITSRNCVAHHQQQLNRIPNHFH